LIALALLVLPWVLAWALVPHHHLDATAVTLLAAVAIPLAGLWLSWAAVRNASGPGPAGVGGITAGAGAVVADHGATAIGPGAVVADRGATAIGQVVFQARGVTGKPVRLTDPPPLLAGREGLLAELDTRLAGDADSGPRTVALCGLGGAGKTSVALAYAHRRLAEVGVAWQFPAEDATVLAAGFTDLAGELGAWDDAGTRDPVASVHAVLAAYPQEWLLVFDNAPDRAAVQKFLPPAGPGRVLVTSRNPQWPPGQALEVPVLATEDAAGFLGERTGDPDEHAVGELAAELGGLPLALEQTAAYIQASGDSLARYLALFRQRRPEMLARGQPTGYDSTVAATWSLAFTQLERSAPQAAGLLRLLACCAPDAIPIRLLLQPPASLPRRLHGDVAEALRPLLDNPLAVNDAVVALRRYSLVTPAGDGLVSVHRLVQAVTLDQMPANLAGQWRQAAAVLIDGAIPANTDPPKTWSVCAVLLPHAQVALADYSHGIGRLANYLGSRGSYAAALELQRRIVDAREQSLGAEHPDTLAARVRLAYFTGMAGDAASARDQSRALLPVVERVLGAEHPDTLAVRDNLAYWTGNAGDAAGARDQFAALVPVHERVYGPNDRETLAVRGNLARWSGYAGDAAGARDQYAALLPVFERVLGTEYPDTLVARDDLARLTGEAGDAAGACDQFAALIPVQERVLGPEHPGTLSVRSSLVRWTGEAGDAAGARDQAAALLPVAERVLGPEHPDTLATRGNLDYWTKKADGSGN
jgi:hypothetical protein